MRNLPLCSSSTYSNGCKSLTRPYSGKRPAGGKGVRREIWPDVQTCMGIIENNLVEVPIVKGDLLTHIVSPSNMNLAYKPRPSTN